jgi:hypothetical protein
MLKRGGGAPMPHSRDRSCPGANARLYSFWGGLTAVKRVSKKWLKQRLAEVRECTAIERREAVMARERDGHDKQTALAFEIMDRCLLDVSDHGRLTANARQMYCVAHDEIQRRSGKPPRGTMQTGLPAFSRP